MPTVKEQTKKIQEQYRKETTDKFRKWVLDRFGRELAEGDRLLYSGDRYSEPELYEVVELKWDYSNPALFCHKLLRSGKRDKFECPIGLARNILKKCSLASRDTTPAKTFKFQVERELMWPKGKSPASAETVTKRHWDEEKVVFLKDTYRAARRLALKLAREHKASGGHVNFEDSDFMCLYDSTGNCSDGWGHISINSVKR